MSASEIKTEIDQQKVREILSRFTLPSEIERVETVFSSDWTGDPSVNLTFHIKDDIHIGDDELKQLSKFLSTVTSALLQGNIGGFPYTKLEQAA